VQARCGDAHAAHKELATEQQQQLDLLLGGGRRCRRSFARGVAAGATLVLAVHDAQLDACKASGGARLWPSALRCAMRRASPPRLRRRGSCHRGGRARLCAEPARPRRNDSRIQAQQVPAPASWRPWALRVRHLPRVRQTTYSCAASRSSAACAQRARPSAGTLWLRTEARRSDARHNALQPTSRTASCAAWRAAQAQGRVEGQPSAALNELAWT
jgi:hypothetical protein